MFFFSHNYEKINVDEYDCLALEKTLNFYDVIILITSLLLKDNNPCYYSICLGKCSYIRFTIIELALLN